MSHLRLSLGVFAFLTACGRPFPTPAPRNEPQPAPDLRTDIGSGRVAPVSHVMLVPDKAVRHYLTTSTTTLQPIPNTDSSQTVIKMTLGFSLTYSHASSSDTRVSGTLTHLSLATEALPQVSSQQLTLPLEFSGYLEGGGFNLDSLAGAPVSAFIDCQVAGLNGIAGVQRNLMVPPLTLSTGMTWTDSSTVSTCSGSVQLSLTAIRTYTVVGQTVRSVNPVIIVDRQDRVRATGEGTQGQHRISILSAGSGSARIYLDPTTGFLRESEAAQRVDVVIGSSGRSQQFRQVVEEQTSLQ